MRSNSTVTSSTSNSYAAALYELSKENSELEKLEVEAQSLHKLLKDSSDFREIISSPTVPKEEKKNVMIALSKQNNFSKTLKNFLGLIAVKNRLFFLDKIIDSFLNLASSNRGELKAKVISSKELSNEDKKNIENELSHNFKSQLKINYEYNPNLIAGLIIQVGSVMIDTSIKTRLKKLEKYMLEA